MPIPEPARDDQLLESSLILLEACLDWNDEVRKYYEAHKTEPAFRQRKPQGGRVHLEKDTAQIQIALAYPSVPFGHFACSHPDPCLPRHLGLLRSARRNTGFEYPI